MLSKLIKSKLLVVPLILLYVWFLVLTAWVSDDGYITFRSVENFLHGYGPVFNIGERVQTFTHPLWFFLLSGVYFIIQHIPNLNAWALLYYVNVGLSIAISILVILLVAFGLARSTRSAFLGVAVLILSKAFIDYSTSGLENPLSHLILVIFLWLYLKGDQPGLIKLLALSFIAGFGALNRSDTLLFFIPALGVAIWQNREKWKALLCLLVGFLPLLVWELFSLFYYGTLFPNTAYAKLHTGINALSLVRQGFFYYVNSIRLDPVTLIAVFGSAGLFLVARQKRLFPIITGTGAYLLYILFIGGDFMSGRYFSTPLLVAAILFSVFDFRSKYVYSGVLLAILLIGLLPFATFYRSPQYYNIDDFRVFIDANNISDERAVYYDRLGLLSTSRTKGPPGSRFSGLNWVFKKDQPIKVKLVGPLGVDSYQVGPNIHIIDVNALADPLMARLPLEDTNKWRIGHFRHVIPEGYMDTLSSGKNSIRDANIKQYYDKLSLVTRGDLFDRRRLLEIWNLNTGKYNHLLEAYAATLK